MTAKPRRPAEPSGSRTTVRRDPIESEMIQHASRLVAERGFAGTHLQDIADAMGATRTALYYYVKSKDDLLAKLVTEITEGAAAEIRSITTDDARDPAAKVRDIARLIALRRADQPARFLLLVRSESELPAPLAKANTPSAPSPTRKRGPDGGMPPSRPVVAGSRLAPKPPA